MKHKCDSWIDNIAVFLFSLLVRKMRTYFWIHCMVRKNAYIVLPYSVMVLHFLTFIINFTINLISKLHYYYAKREHYLSGYTYLKISRWRTMNSQLYRISIFFFFDGISLYNCRYSVSNSVLNLTICIHMQTFFSFFFFMQWIFLPLMVIAESRSYHLGTI